jgi:hypothetical protein
MPGGGILQFLPRSRVVPLRAVAATEVRVVSHFHGTRAATSQ